VLWWLLILPVAYLKAVTDSWAVLIGGFIADSVLATAYLIYASRRAARQARS